MFSLASMSQHAVILLLWAAPVARGGFCLNDSHPLLTDTGFTAVSDLDKESCLKHGYEWCPLVNETATWEKDGESIAYFWFSACCTGRQNSTLIIDEDARHPTCKEGVPRKRCKRGDWLTKLMGDLLDRGGYEFLIVPSGDDLEMDASVNAASIRPECLCKATDPACEMKSNDGEKCLICKTDRQCGGMVVSFGLNLFKIESVDLRSSQLSLAAWLRQSWRDERLSYDSQCYGGVDTWNIQAKAGDLEHSKIWTPDLELYNSKANIWDGSHSARLASVYACSSPARSSCGSIWWSRPGIIDALCMYEGLVMFPFDQLRCKLEFAAWSLDGRFQDIVPRSVDGGVSFHGNPNAKEKAVAGLTAGSKFQNYGIENVTVERKVVFYDCCPNSPYPELIYEIRFRRASSYYFLKLVIPVMFLTGMSFLSFWMPPASGERLGYGITVILAMLANDIVASEMMPVCNERVYMDYLNLGCWLFGCLALLETGLVVLLHHQTCETWTEAIVSSDALRILTKLYRQLTNWRRARQFQSTMRRTLSSQNAKMVDAFKSKEAQLRRPIYKQIFWELDTNFDNELKIEEFQRFWQPMFGEAWNRENAEACLTRAGLDIAHTLTEAEFCYFCESSLPHKDDHDYMQQKLEHFMQLAEHERRRIAAMWATRAQTIDDFAQWALPPGFFVTLIWLNSSTEEDLMKLSEDHSGFAGTLLMGFAVFILLVVAAGLISFLESYLKVRARRRISLGRALSSNSNSGGNEPPETESSSTSMQRGTHDDVRRDGDCVTHESDESGEGKRPNFAMLGSSREAI